jgi:hypothetical protein
MTREMPEEAQMFFVYHLPRIKIFLENYYYHILSKISTDSFYTFLCVRKVTDVAWCEVQLLNI